AAHFQHALPQSSLQYIAHPLNKDVLFQLLKYRIVSSDLSTLRTIYTMYEGLEYRIKKYIHEAQSYDHLIAAHFQHALPQSSLQYIAHPLNKDVLFQLLKYRI
uniref:nucleotidyltransferase family protein n=1 Tax=Cronobacter malonaticus TaxID=413503 RepID=UPI0018F8A77C